jgi:hypothetical protein
MANPILVGPEIDAGAALLKALDAAGLKVKVAMWAVLAEYEDWRIVLASPQLDRAGRQGPYGLIRDALDKAGFAMERRPDCVVVRMTDPFVRQLRRLFGKAKSVEGMRLGGQLFGDRYIEDAYVYRIV